MKKKDYIEKDIADEKLREILSGTKLKADENLKYRIMQQIHTESVISGTNKSETKFWSRVKNLGAVMAVMYALILVTIAATFIYGGKEALFSTELFMALISISSVCIAFGAISFFDEKIRSKK